MDHGGRETDVRQVRGQETGQGDMGRRSVPLRHVLRRLFPEGARLRQEAGQGHLGVHRGPGRPRGRGVGAFPGGDLLLRRQDRVE